MRIKAKLKINAGAHIQCHGGVATSTVEFGISPVACAPLRRESLLPDVREPLAFLQPVGAHFAVVHVAVAREVLQELAMRH
eukprot:CAMPEP_0117566114 /NCGR_PEP_ID=MMETSP0784-20121206/56924_1 /TAXON_ID=39447 /ORGANISM="" /LENGTH=80 /DNA_ID=CAMNT_0005363943 /DNA_START=34 /DNA_END=276 /DNA_ORIENTATION=-